MISFYVASGEYGFLSNFSAHGFLLEGKYWPTVEHYFQAQKFAGTSYQDRIRAARCPKEAKRLGQSRRIPLRSDWEEVKVDVMRAALAAKFSTHADLREALLGTGEQTIVENAPGDLFWGCGLLGNGQNQLGKLLMEIRTTIKDGEYAGIGQADHA